MELPFKIAIDAKNYLLTITYTNCHLAQCTWENSGCHHNSPGLDIAQVQPSEHVATSLECFAARSTADYWLNLNFSEDFLTTTYLEFKGQYS